MSKRVKRSVLAASVLAAASMFFVDLSTGSASAAVTPTLLTGEQRHPVTGYHADRMIVDSVRQRLLVADDVAHRILAVDYDGNVASEVALPDGANAGDFKLSADSGTLWAILPDPKLIVSWNAATLEEIERYPIAVFDPGHLALTADKVWFSNNKNSFGSLDPVTGEVVNHVLGNGNNTSATSAQPLIAASPTDPNRLVLSSADNRGDLFLYDISGATPALVATTQSGLVSGNFALEYAADGGTIYSGGINGVYVTPSRTLASFDSRTISMNRALDVEAASNGWFAAALPPAADQTDLRLYRAGELSAAREFDFPITGAAPEFVDLEWEPSGDRLFVITTDETGAQSLWTIAQPTVIPSPSVPAATPTAITLAGPATTPRGELVSIRGTITGGVPMGTEIKISRTDSASPGGVTLPAMNANGSGQFIFMDTPPVAGTATWTVTFAGTAKHQASSATVSIPVVVETPTPSLIPTTITLKAPATASRGAAVTIQGTIAGYEFYGGVPVTVRRTDAESTAGFALASRTTTSSGTFTITDTPGVGGTVTYTVAFAGTATHKASSAKVSIAVAKSAPALTLNRNGSVFAYGTTVTMTAHLGSTYKNRTVEIWADPYGSDQARRLIKKGTVNSSGDLSVAFKLTRNTTFSTVFAGDTRFAARTVTSAVKTKAAVSLTVSKHYKKVKSYYYVRKTKHPKFATTMTAYSGRKQKLVFQQYSGGKWKAWKTGTYKLSAAGKYTFTLTGTHKTGVKYRVQAVYLTGTSGDSANQTTYGAWQYFTFTK
ncbi:hypothetical protein FB565_004966 [Actinoplanes lutulentus]|uniref:Ig-like domain-containing protein n=1 Tax=Actinoplanes lutulentus TaxID=1287878 RepID=A0A327ZNU9_9ACTN|nr:hypothetical protein [Actinoplanes lutulentus]MBB2945233.1 hypothetical protein [Actinoplanes lutulentus]RAK40631.1 hypothetical protein B0I29_103671 [Actinoplanes lutulentus]